MAKTYGNLESFNAEIAAKEEKPLSLRDKLFQDLIIIRGVIKRKIRFRDCSFDAVKICDLLLLPEIEFENCQFKSTFLFERSPEFKRDIHSKHDSKIVFTNCNIFGIKFSDFNTPYNIKFISNNGEYSNIKELEIFDLNCECCITFSRMEISDYFRMQSINIRELIFQDSKISAELLSQSLQISEFKIINCEVYSKRFIIKNLRSFDFQLIKNKFYSPFMVDKVWIDHRFNIYENEFYDIVNIALDEREKVQVEELNLSGNNSIDNFTISGRNRSKVITLNHFSTGLTSGAFILMDLDCENLQLSGTNTNGTIVFQDVQVTNLSILQFYNSSQLSFSNATVAEDKDSTLNISNSQLGSAKLSNIDLNSFRNISIKNSDFSELKTFNIKWFDVEELNVSFSEQREIYRQIKFIYEKQGDRINSLKFKAYELTAYSNELFKDIPKIKRPFNKERFILLASWASNNFGLSWTRPIIISFFTVLIFWMLITIETSTRLSWSFSFGNIKNTIMILEENAGAFWQLFNPTHRLTNVYSDLDQLGGFAYALSFFLKLIMAYLIFQTITAFRKYIK